MHTRLRRKETETKSALSKRICPRPLYSPRAPCHLGLVLRANSLTRASGTGEPCQRRNFWRNVNRSTEEWIFHRSRKSDDIGGSWRVATLPRRRCKISCCGILWEFFQRNDVSCETSKWCFLSKWNFMWNFTRKMNFHVKFFQRNETSCEIFSAI